MDLSKKISELQQLASAYGKTDDSKKRKSIKKESVKLYFEVEEELAKIKYDLRLIDIRNYKDEEKEQLKLFPDFFADLLDIPDQQFLAHVKQNALPIPLLLFLFYNHNKNMTALTSSAVLMDTVKPYLHEGDFQHLKSGSIRFITNTRFASDHLRRYGLLRTSEKEKYKYWQLTLFGTIIAAMIFEDDKFEFPENNIYQTNQYFLSNTLYKYTNLLLKNNGFEQLLKRIFADEIVNEIYSLKHDFISFLAELLHIIKKTKKDQKEFFNKYGAFLKQIDDKVFAKDFANGFLLNLPSANKYDQLMKDAFTKKY
jgi:hypothetical protein